MSEVVPLAPREFGRWAWRQLTSMRTALVLLLLLALAAIPGSVVPQQSVDALRAAQWRDQHPTLTPIYERLGLFSVYDSVWFSAIYLLLMVSLVGCIVPRTAVYLRAMLARPPKTPQQLSRLPEHRTVEVEAGVEDVLARARRGLARYRRDEDGHEIAAEKGHLREAGNLLFHVSLLVVLVGFAAGSMLGFRGGVIVVSGGSFANALSQYDDFDAGALFTPDDLAPFSFTVDDFDVQFITEGREAGMAHTFEAGITYRAHPGDQPRTDRLAVNHPLTVDDTSIFLIGHGYAPRITVRNGAGQVAFSGPVVFLPEDESFRSFGVIQVPDLGDGSAQLGFEGEFYPTYAFTPETGPFAAFPDARNPALSLLVYAGDLGLDDGVPQSVYALDKSGLDPVEQADGTPLRVDLGLGRDNSTVQLPDGLGSITFDGVSRFVKLQVSRSPGDWVALTGVCLALLGLLGSLFVRPRRVWVRARPADRPGARRTLVEVAGLDRSTAGGLADELDRIVTVLQEGGP